MQNLKALRKQRAMTQNAIANILGINANTLCQYETGKRKPSIEVLKKLSLLFNCTIDELVNETKNKEA